MEEPKSRQSISFHSESGQFHQGPIWQQRFTVFLAVLTGLCMIFTIFFAYNISLEQPLSTKLIFEKPERSILVLNVASQITIFCLAELTSAVLEATRWAFACTNSGTSAYTFLALSRATSIVGVLSLLFSNGAKPKTFQKDGHRLWGGQRYFLAFAALIIIKDCYSC
jgi:hypothetical protein